ncbi:MAG: FIST C-terminal domain-containing protein [Gammaproteobacteria bacterium]|nr:FIST C-terminal domain-containing protein [Gammaproteobacteria bacterium]
MESQKYVKTAQITNLSAPIAAALLKDKIYQKNMAGVIFFCSPNYNLELLGKSLEKHFDCPVIGCTTAGEIGENYTDNSIVGISFSSKAFKLTPTLIKDVSHVNSETIEKLKSTSNTLSAFKNKVGFLLVDGMSAKEESVINTIYNIFSPLPIIGGSAGDGMRFEKTFVYSEGIFHHNAAVFTVIETLLDFEIFKLQHFSPSDIDFVITQSDPEKRIVYEIDGEPATEYFASLFNIPIDELSTESFTQHPTMLKIGSEWYLRSFTVVNSDGSLYTACAIENGTPLTLGKPEDILQSLEEQISQLKQKFSNIQLTLGCDCLSRKLEITACDLTAKVEEKLNQINLYGFNTYGEQYNSIHVNQTLTGITFGTKRR